MNEALRVILVIACLVSGVGCVKTNQESVVISTSKMQTVCFGESKLKIPQSFGLREPGSSATFYYGRDADFTTVEFEVVADKVEIQEFSDAVAGRAAEIAGEMNEIADAPMLVAHEDLGDQAFLLRYFDDSLSSEYHVHEVHRLVGSVHVLLKADSYEGKMGPVEARLKHLAASVSRASDESEPAGFCLGPVVINSDSDYQMGTIHYRDEAIGHRDVALEIGVNTLPRDQEEPRLMSRMGGNFLGLGLSPRVLQKGGGYLSDMPAEQWLGRHVEDSRVEHLFVIDSYPEEPSPRTPGLQISLRTGGVPRSPVAGGLRPYIDSSTDIRRQEEPMTSSLSDDEAIKMWEAIIGSVRPR